MRWLTIARNTIRFVVYRYSRGCSPAVQRRRKSITHDGGARAGNLSPGVVSLRFRRDFGNLRGAEICVTVRGLVLGGLIAENFGAV